MKYFIKICFSLAVLAGNSNLFAQGRINSLEEAKQSLAITENLGKKLPLDLKFKDENDREIRIGDYFKDGLPVILVPAYFKCANLCTMVLKGLLEALKEEKKYKVGRDFRIVSYSINPEETPELAAGKKAAHISELSYNEKDKKNAEAGWHFLTTKDTKTINQLSEAIGFRFRKIDSEYAHSAIILFINKNADIARYLFGFVYKPTDFRLAFLESAEGRVGDLADRILQFCFTYESGGHYYKAVAWRIMTIGVVICLIAFAIFLGFFWFREYKKARQI